MNPGFKFAEWVLPRMKNAGGSESAKRAAGESAAEAVEDGMVVGLGTGSTAAHAIRAIGEQVDAGLDVRGVPTSFQARQLAREAGVPLAELDEVDGIDLAIEQISQLSDSFRQGQFGLTTSQYETIVEAYEGGYYSVPRGVNLEDLARRLGVSHQALSERLRRGHETLIENALRPRTEVETRA